MGFENMKYLNLLALVFTTFFGLVGGMVFIWMALIEGWHFIYFVCGFIMVIAGMIAMTFLILYSAWKEDRIYGV